MILLVAVFQNTNLPVALRGSAVLWSHTGFRTAWVQIPALPLTCRLTSDKRVNLSVLSFPLWQTGGGGGGGRRELLFTKGAL